MTDAAGSARAFFSGGALLGVVAACLAASCGGSPRECNVGADCVSGACSAEGACVTIPDSGGGPMPDAGEDVATGMDSAPPVDASPGTDGGCMAGDGGSILRSQIVLLPGLHATFRIATNATVSTAGEVQKDGSLLWDLSGAIPGAADVLVDTLGTSGAWYASSFGTATYATTLSSTSPLLGVFEATGSDLLLEGVVSPTSGATETKLTYAPPVPTLQFPLAEGGTWSVRANVTGKADGVPGVYVEDYATKVDAHGKVKTPLATFEALRVGTVLTRTVGVTVTVIRSFAWVTDCYGVIAQMTSRPDEPGAEFTKAAEVRRIAP